ncbi:hypothetical protein F8M41_010367 [Gigaspora margarita]|uniref:Uncharacterized protein n=1 Tax=Gigaspora margarita TaxID=4874 RepID=A0A8H3X2A8_GIGMA|nr:hypothetical protein F8M41_010367 [Gigaspora margarita]
MQEEEIENLATKLTLESKTLNYENQELQSLIRAYLEIYTKEEKKRVKMTATKEIVSIKKSNKENIAPTKRQKAGPLYMVKRQV